MTVEQWPRTLRSIGRVLELSLPAGLGAPGVKATTDMAKAWYGNPALHYEIWVRRRLRVVELGLHFEADDLTNARLLAAFRTRAGTVQRLLGAHVRIEEWDKGWARIWEPLSLELPEAELRERVVTRLVAYVRALEPMLRDELPADVEWTAPTSKRVPRRSPRRPARPGATSSRASR